MAISAELDFDGRAAQKFFDKLNSNSKDVKKISTEYIKTVSSFVISNLIENFETEKGPDGGWKPWSKTYAEHMQRIGKGGNKILQDTGRLRQNIRPTNVKKTGDGILYFNPAKTKTGFPYAAHHDETANTPRPFMWITDRTLERVGEATLRFILNIK